MFLEKSLDFMVSNSTKVHKECQLFMEETIQERAASSFRCPPCSRLPITEQVDAISAEANQDRDVIS